MFNIIVSNFSTILVGLAVATLVTLITIKMIRDKKKGKGSCGCNCSNCPNGGNHHSER